MLILIIKVTFSLPPFIILPLHTQTHLFCPYFIPASLIHPLGNLPPCSLPSMSIILPKSHLWTLFSFSISSLHSSKSPLNSFLSSLPLSPVTQNNWQFSNCSVNPQTPFIHTHFFNFSINPVSYQIYVIYY